ncbi:hypothetical protein CU048_14905 [Beijerinckiaceae bacterium]|nr:hypothetical protein CU048_14905 [Beijerinckiaceae bacterium]
MAVAVGYPVGAIGDPVILTGGRMATGGQGAGGLMAIIAVGGAHIIGNCMRRLIEGSVLRKSFEISFGQLVSLPLGKSEKRTPARPHAGVRRFMDAPPKAA